MSIQVARPPASTANQRESLDSGLSTRGGAMPSYDLFVYHDLSDDSHSGPPEIGQDAAEWFGKGFEGLYVTAFGPGIHEGRMTVVLSTEKRPDGQQEIKQFFDPPKARPIESS
jgi:hypothetical protein